MLFGWSLGRNLVGSGSVGFCRSDTARPAAPQIDKPSFMSTLHPRHRILTPAEAALGAARVGGAGRVVSASVKEAAPEQGDGLVDFMPLSLPTVRLGGIDLHAVTRERAVETVLSEHAAGRGGTVLTVNLSRLRRCRYDVTYQALIAEADLVVADGMPLVLASRLRGERLPNRVTGPSLLGGLCERAAATGRRVFLLGRDPAATTAAAARLRSDMPDIEVAGTHCPGRDFEYDAHEVARIHRAIYAASPDYIFVALGSPGEEKLISQLRRNFPLAWWIGVGVSFDYLAGHESRAPAWMQRLGLEWAHRFARSPRERFGEYVLYGAPFAFNLLAQSAASGMVNRLLPTSSRKAARRMRRESLLRLRQAGRRFDPLLRARAETNEAATAASADGAPTAASEVQPKPKGSSPAVGPIRRGPSKTDVSPGTSPDTQVHRGGSDADLEGVYKRLKGVLLLAGRARPNAFTLGIGRPTLELPIGLRGAGGVPVASSSLVRQERLIDGWLRWIEDLSQNAGTGHALPIRIIVGDVGDAPSTEAPPGGVDRRVGAFEVVRDPKELRGTGGLMRDFSDQYDDDDLLLVCNAQQVMVDPLSLVVRSLCQRIAAGADVALVAHDDGTPSGVMLVRCGATKTIGEKGYNDMKEQGLPAIAAEHDVRVLRARRPVGQPVRTEGDYIAALRRYHAHLAGRGRGAPPPPLGMPLAEHHTSSFVIIEPGAEVHPDAYVHDSVILAGARVEAGATVVRSIVCDGGVVRRTRRVMDETVVRRFRR